MLLAIAGWIIMTYIFIVALLTSDRIAMRVVDMLHSLYKQANEYEK